MDHRGHMQMIEPATSHVQFEVTLDEVVDVQHRMLRESKIASSWRRKGRVAAAAITGVILFLSIQLLPDTVTAASLFGAAVAFLVVYSVYPMDHERRVRRRLRRLLTERLGDVQSVHCEVELLPRGTRVRRAAVEITFDWGDLQTIEDTPDGIEYLFKSGIVLVRSRAFASQVARDQFLAQSRALAHQAST